MFNHSKAAHLIRGEKSEQLACTYLIKQGLQLIEKNFSCRYGELDIIMRDQQTLVIVEVRFRKKSNYVSALESITAKKQSRIITSTEYYLQLKKFNSAVRFDVITLSDDTNINWIKNAFQT